MPARDLVAQLPDSILHYQATAGDPTRIWIVPGSVAEIRDQEYFIHAAATLPVEEFTSDLGFGLWVAVSRSDFLRYLEALEDDAAYADFGCSGVLACNWPTFADTLGEAVTIQVIDPKHKVHIVAIQTHHPQLQSYQRKGSMDEDAHAKIQLQLRSLKPTFDDPISDN